MSFPDIIRLREIKSASKVVAQDINADYMGITQVPIQQAITDLST